MIGVGKVGPAAMSICNALAGLDDNFQENFVSPRWTMRKPAATQGATVWGGFLRLPILGGGTGANRSFWFDNDDGILLYQSVTGDFDAQAYCEARNAADTAAAPVTNFQIVGLACHDPAEAPGTYNYVHVGLGSNGTASLQVEFKTTNNSVSTFTYTPLVSGSAWIRLVRIGQVFTTYWRTSTSNPWTLRDSVDRSAIGPAMPNTLQLGLMTYANVAVSDILGRFANFTVIRP